MGTRLLLQSSSALLALLLAFICGCSGSSTQQPSSGDSAELAAAIDQLDQSNTPQGVDSSDWDLLTNELQRVLEQKSQGRLASFVGDHPCGGEIVDESLSWRHDLRGDYDNNGQVNISDLTPLAQHLGSDASAAVAGSMLWRIDGNMDGEINISDVTPIGANFLASAKAYEVLHSTVADEEGSVVERIELSSGILGLTKGSPELSVTLQATGYYSVRQIDLKGQAREVVDPIHYTEPVLSEGVRGFVHSTTGGPIAGVLVYNGLANTAITDSEGYFEIGIDTSSLVALLRFSSSSHTENMVEVPLVPGGVAECNVVLQPREFGGKINATAGGSFTAPDGASFSVPAGALVGQSGTVLAGELDIWLTTPDGLSGNDAGAVPVGAGTDSMVGALEIFIDDGNGGHAQLAAGKSAQISLPLFAGIEAAGDSASRATFDMDSARWISEGDFSISGGLLSGSISHLSWFGGFGIQSEDPELLVVRDDGGIYDANYDAIIADLDALGALYMEVDFDEDVVDTYVNGNYLAAIWYRGGQGDVSEPAQGTYLWDSADYEQMFDIMEVGGNVVLFSQQHTSANPIFTAPNFLHSWWGYEFGFDYAHDSNVETAFSGREGLQEGFYLPELPILTDPVTVFPNTNENSSFMLNLGSQAVQAAEAHSASGGSGLTPLGIELPLTLPFISRGIDLPMHYSNPDFTGGLSISTSDDRAVLSYGNIAAPGFDGLGTGRYYCVGYSWNVVSVDSAVDGNSDPASMERWQLMQNILAWLDNGLTFNP